MHEFWQSFLVALGGTVAAGVLLLPLLRRLKAGQVIRTDGPARHLGKSGTPTMGGLAFLLGLTAAVLATGRPGPATWLLLGLTWGFALVGFSDDLLKVVWRRSLGLKARHKLGAEVLLALALGLGAAWLGREPVLHLPGGGEAWLGWGYLALVVLVVVATTNAVNLTDGLDGLAAGVTFFAALAFLLLSGQAGLAEEGLFASALAGGCAGFLFFNRHPARLFMGDTGSLALGAALSGLAILSGREIWLLLVGGVYVAEALSVILQVLAFRTTGRRIFRMSPLHHHFELAGWGEQRVVYTFWLAAFLLAALAVLFS